MLNVLKLKLLKDLQGQRLLGKLRAWSFVCYALSLPNEARELPPPPICNCSAVKVHKITTCHSHKVDRKPACFFHSVVGETEAQRKRDTGHRPQSPLNLKTPLIFDTDPLPPHTLVRGSRAQHEEVGITGGDTRRQRTSSECFNRFALSSPILQLPDTSFLMTSAWCFDFQCL